MLLGGVAVVTVRERSSLTITEVPGRRSAIDLTSGKVKVAVASERMRAGDTIEVRTPNAVAACGGRCRRSGRGGRSLARSSVRPGSPPAPEAELALRRPCHGSVRTAE